MSFELPMLRGWWFGVADGSEEHWPFELCATALSASLMLAIVLLLSNASLLHPSFKRTFTTLTGLEQAKLRLAVTIVRATRRGSTDCGGTFVEGANIARRRQLEADAQHEQNIDVPRVGVREVSENCDDGRLAQSTQLRRPPLSGAMGVMSLAKLRTAVGLKVRARQEAPTRKRALCARRVALTCPCTVACHARSRPVALEKKRATPQPSAVRGAT